MSTCVQSTIDVKADKRYEREVAGNIAISVGVGMIILFVTICALHYISTPTAISTGISFENNTKLFDFKGHMAYAVVMSIFFFISFSCFIGYGGRLGKGPTKKKDTVVSWLLAAAIIFLLISATMLWFKVYVYTKS
jgi:hypothetical protein